jgi:hypothetical protein
MITDDEPSYHFIALYRRLSARPYRILYVGLDSELMNYLEQHLEDCWTTRAPSASVARPFIVQLKHSLMLFDELLMDTTPQELTRFTRALAHTKRTPIIIVKNSDNLELLVRTITRLLTS